MEPPAPDPPDWSAIEHDVLCPLCGYNLRGLSEGRCPECGHRFDWAEVTSADRQVHPYLFEHHATDDLLSAPKTLAGGLLPRRFWTTLKPVQPSRPLWLGGYAVLILLSLALPLVLGLVLGLPDYPVRRGWWGVSTVRQDWAWRNMYNFPYSMAAPLLGLELRRLVPVMLAAWAGLPLAVYATLLVFQQSMRRARLRQHHLLRCVVYSADVLVWPALALGVLVVFNSLPWNPGRHAERIAWLLLAGFPLAWAAIAYRLHVAWARYLRMEQAGAVMLAVHFIVLLIAALALAVAGPW